MHNESDLLTSAQACALLGVNRSTLSRWAAREPQRIEPAIKHGGLRGPYLFRRADVERLAAQRSAA